MTIDIRWTVTLMYPNRGLEYAQQVLWRLQRSPCVREFLWKRAGELKSEEGVPPGHPHDAQQCATGQRPSESFLFQDLL